MSFQDILKQQLEQQTQNSNTEVDYPSKKLKNKELYFPKPTGHEPSQLMIRILPPAIPNESYNVPSREIFLTARNRNNKELKPTFVLSPFPNQEDPIDMAVTRWMAENRVPNTYNKKQKPKSVYLVNVIQLFSDPSGQLVEERDQQGNPVVRLFKLPASACKTINEKLGDPLFRPQNLQGVPEEIAQYSFISSASAFPIRLTKPKQGSGQMHYDVDVFTNYPLGALPQGWENLLEDLQYQATPSYKYNQEFIEYFISVVDGTEPVQGQGQGQPQQGFQPQQPNYGGQPNYGAQQGYQQPPVQPQGGFQTPPQPNFGGQQAYQQPPVQPQQGYQQPPVQATNMGTPTYGMTNMGTAPDMNDAFGTSPYPVPPISDPMGQQAPQYPHPAEQPTQPVYEQPAPPAFEQPAQNVAPAPTNTPVTPPPAQNVAPVENQQVTPPPTQVDSGLPDITELLNQMNS